MNIRPFTMVAIGLAMGLPQPGFAQIFVNLLANPNFESVVSGGDGSGWDRRGPTSITLNQVANPVQDGFYALEVGGRDTSEVKIWYGVKQALTGVLLPETVYRISGYARLSGSQADDNLILQLIKKLSDGTTQYQSLASGTITSSGFTLFEGEFSFPETNITELTLSVHGPGGGKSFIIDDFLLYDPNAPPPAGDTLAPDAFVFKSSGSAAGSGGWKLDGPGYIGSFFNNVGTETVEVTLQVDVVGVEHLGEAPVLEIFTGVSREQRTINAGASREFLTFDLPPGKHTLRISLLNPALGPERSLTLSAVEVFGEGILFDNTEANVFPAAENTITYFRKQPYTLLLHDQTGMRLGPGSVVTMEPILPEFNFGIGVKGWNSNASTADRRDWVDPTHPDYVSLQPVRDFIANNFNTIVTNNAGKWAPVENNRDVLDYGVLDLIQGFAGDNNLRLRLHAVAWAKSGGNPGWAMDLMNAGLSGNTSAKTDLRAEISERITDYITGRAGDWIELDGINEGFHEDGLLRLYGFEGVAGIYEETYDALRAMGSTTPVYFNEFGTFNRFNDPYANWWVDHIHKVLARIPSSKRADGFGIGHQSYVSNKSGQGSFLDPTTYYRVLQNSASMGLPMSITEFGVKQDPAPVPTYLQSAELLRQAMTIALGNDRVNTFIVWNFLQGEMFTGATAAPMLLDDGNLTLTDFGRAWQHLTGRADHSDILPGYPQFAGPEQVTISDDGRLHYRGLPGRYRISNGDFSIEVDLDDAGEFIINGPPQRNILMIVVDDLKPTIGAYGDPYAVTPVMDRLAEEGVMFTNTHCQMAICAPSRASVLTGLRPDSTGVLDLTTQVRDVHPDIITLPQHFSNYGYTTHGISKIFHGSNAQVQDSPISWNDGWQAHGVNKKFYEPGKSEEENQLRSQGRWNAANTLSATDRGAAVDTDYGDGVTALKGVAKIGEYASAFKSSGQPFFLAVGFQKPHLPFNAPEEYWSLYDETDFNMSAYTPFFDYPEGAPEYARPFSGEPGSYGDGWPAGDEGIILAPDATEANRLVHGYYACASFIDAQIGKLLDELENQGIADETIVLLWSDHGFHLGDHGAFWAKHSNYEQATRSVLMVRAPGVTRAGGVVDAPTELVDIFPTLCQLTGLPYPLQPNIGPLQGNGLEPVLRDPQRPWRKSAFSQYHRGGDDLKMGYSMRTHRYRLTSWFPRGELTDPSTTGTTPTDEEFYDYLTAPGEPVNLVNSPQAGGPLASLRPVMLGDRWNDPAVQQPFDNPALISPITEWKTAYFPLETEANTITDVSDPDHDGLSVSLEYILGLSPLAPDHQSVELFFFPAGGSSISLTLDYPSPLDRPDYAAFPEWSNDLNDWVSSGLILTADPVSGRSQATLSSASAPAFLRLKVRKN
jgi:arylsulfatase A-like enzyme/GH35 family endo-1,4-beta-xylanase